MRYKALFVTTLLSLFILENPAKAVPSKWEEVSTSFNDLLSSGWTITGHSSNRVASYSGVLRNKDYDEQVLTFLLTKSGKNIVCFVIEPRPPSANFACRRLN
jgi:hypothetical protein